MVKKKPPVNLQLWTIRFPVTAVVSILHRLSGLALFFLIPVLLWAFDMALHSEAGFIAVRHCLASLCGQLFMIGVSTSFVYHCFAGIRHLLMDFHIGDSLAAGRWSAYIVLFASGVLVVMMVLAIGFYGYGGGSHG
jgi:succinate dehydrogenase / fumarate reductase cytochrome b subunit